MPASTPPPRHLPAFLRADGPDTLVAVLAKPRARSNLIEGAQGEALKVHVAAPPVDGAANTALERHLANALGLGRTRVQVLRGNASRHKLVRIVGLTPAEVLQQLDPNPANPSPDRDDSGREVTRTRQDAKKRGS